MWLTGRWRRRRLTRPGINRVLFYVTQAELPDELPCDALAVVGSKKHPKWAILDCPCGHGHRLTVNLSKARRPYWRLTIGESGPSLYPSVDVVTSRRCHFWLRDGRVHWVRDWFKGRRDASRGSGLT